MDFFDALAHKHGLSERHAESQIAASTVTKRTPWQVFRVMVLIPNTVILRMEVGRLGKVARGSAARQIIRGHWRPQ